MTEFSATDSLERAEEVLSIHPDEAAQLCERVLQSGENDEEAGKLKEKSVYLLSKIRVAQKNAEALVELLKEIRPLFAYLPKAKTAKLVRSLLDSIAKIPGTLPLQVSMCEESIEWSKEEKRTFLKQRLEARLASLYHQAGRFKDALAVLETLSYEVRKLDDKPLLVEVYLTESQVFHSLENVPKARASLTAARTNANAIYCPPPLQAQIDLQSGKIHLDERDYKTAFSYFFEAFEAFDSLSEGSLASLCLKCMMLAKLMVGSAEDVQSAATGKTAIKYTGRGIEAMLAIASSYKDRSLKKLEKAMADFEDEIVQDKIVKHHLSQLYDTLLEQNLCRIIEPFEQVEIAHVAKLIGQPHDSIERKLSKMILDRKLNGILDQSGGCLIMFSEEDEDATYPAAMETIEEMNRVVDLLYEKAKGM